MQARFLFKSLFPSFCLQYLGRFAVFLLTKNVLETDLLRMLAFEG